MTRKPVATLLVAASMVLVLLPFGGAANSSGIGFAAPVKVGGGVYGGEPNILVQGSNVLVSNVNGQVWKSTNRGSSWSGAATFPGSQLCCGDFDITNDSAGNVFGVGLADLAYSDVAKSTNAAGSWGAAVKTAYEEDRPWLAAGAANEVYLAYHDMATQLVYVEKSADGGATWAPRLPATTSPDGAAFSFGNTLDGPIVRGNDSWTYVVWAASDPVHDATTPPYAGQMNRLYVSALAPGGLVFSTTNVYSPPGVPIVQDDSQIVGFPWLTVDGAGNVYAVWTDAMDGAHYNVYYAYSTDHAATFSAPILVHGGDTAAFVAAAAGSDGRLDVAWYGANDTTSPTSETGDWFLKFAQSTNAHAAAPTFNETLADPGAMHHGSICLDGILCDVLGGDRSLLDFFEIALDANGAANIAYADNAPGGGNPTLDFVRQDAGPSAYGTGTVPP